MSGTIVKNEKFFNTAGLCFPENHYMVNPLPRLEDVEGLIDDRQYFTIHAPRQTGKTTYLYAMARKLNGEGKYAALVVSFEQAGYSSITVKEANELLILRIYQGATEQLPQKEWPQNPETGKFINIKQYLKHWAENQEKPIVLLIDEIDALLDEVLISILRQLRDGYQSRPKHFPASVALVGLRDVRDYRIKVREEINSMGTGSPFNVKSDSLFLTNFTKEDVFSLLEQHTKETGQVFPVEAKEEIFRLSNGQPWLTNALARQMISKILKDDYSQTITLELVHKAKQQLIMRRDTHLDSLVDKLKEERVIKIVQTIINGDNLAFDILDDDIAYVRDLGIVGQSSPIEFANPIYAEIIPRIMSSPIQESIPKEIQPPHFVREDGSLDIEKVLKEFQAFYRRHSGSWLDRYAYKEAANHLILMAFFQRVVNAGGDISRGMAVGNGRIDMVVKFGEKGQHEYALELKIKRGNYTIEEGKEQLNTYLDTLGLNKGYLVIFDPGDKDWDEKVYWKKISYKNKEITMVGI